MVTPGGVVETVVRGLPSSQTSAAIGSLVSGTSSVAFVGHQLYGLAHPVADPEADDFEPDGTWYSMIAFDGLCTRWTPTTVSSTASPRTGRLAV
jgi:hypothetical protein